MQIRKLNKILFIPAIIILVLLLTGKKKITGDSIEGLLYFSSHEVRFTVENTDFDGDYTLSILDAQRYFSLLMDSYYEPAEEKMQTNGGIRILFEGEGIRLENDAYQMLTIDSGGQKKYYRIVHETAEQTERLLNASNIILNIIQDDH